MLDKISRCIKIIKQFNLKWYQIHDKSNVHSSVRADKIFHPQPDSCEGVGTWEFLPSETALAAEYGVSQGTLRKALNELALEKKLVRFQGKGTAVAVLDSDGALFPFFRLYDDDGKRVYPLSQMTSTQYDMAKRKKQ